MTESLLHSVGAATVLKKCIEQSGPCRLHLLHSGHVVDAKIHGVVAGHLILHVPSTLQDESLQPDAMCCVVFPVLHCLYAFLGCVKRIREADSRLEILFDLPTTVTETNLRRSFRVPVSREAGVALTMQLSDGSQVKGEVLNVSESGVEVDLLADDVRLPVHTEVRSSLLFREERIELPAIVRRRESTHCALQFAPGNSLESRQRMVALQRVVRSLEQIWLKSRRTDHAAM